MKVTQMLRVHEANLVANNGNAAFGVDIIGMWNSAHVLSSGIYAQLPLCEKLWKHIGVMVCQKSAYPNCSGTLTNCSGTLITVPEDL